MFTSEVCRKQFTDTDSLQNDQAFLIHHTAESIHLTVAAFKKNTIMNTACSVVLLERYYCYVDKIVEFQNSIQFPCTIRV